MNELNLHRLLHDECEVDEHLECESIERSCEDIMVHLFYDLGTLEMRNAFT